MATEIDLLCSAAQVHPHRAGLKTIERALNEETIDWSRLLALASAHGVAPLLHQTFSTYFPSSTPPPVLAQLQKSYRENALRTFVMTAELLRLLTLFQEKGIKVVPYKGPVLAETLYGDPALREYGDLDILIRREDATSVEQILRREGYHLRRWGTPLTEWFHIWRRGTNMYTSEAGGTPVNIQWRLTMLREFAYPLQSDRFWSQLRQDEVAGQAMWMIRPQELLLMLCIHGVRHYWETLKWLCDVNELMREYELDWFAILDWARSLGNERLLLHSLDLVQQLFHSPLDETIATAIERDPMVRELSQFVIQTTLFGPPTNGPIRYPDYFIRLRERWRERLWPLLYHRVYFPLGQRLHLVRFTSKD